MSCSSSSRRATVALAAGGASSRGEEEEELDKSKAQRNRFRLKMSGEKSDEQVRYICLETVKRCVTQYFAFFSPGRDFDCRLLLPRRRLHLLFQLLLLLMRVRMLLLLVGREVRPAGQVIRLLPAGEWYKGIQKNQLKIITEQRFLKGHCKCIWHLLNKKVAIMTFYALTVYTYSTYMCTNLKYSHHDVYSPP